MSISLSVCPSVCMSRFFAYLMLSQLRSKLHQTFSICKVWSPNLFKIVWASPRACVHAQRVKPCTLFLPIFFDILNIFSGHFEALPDWKWKNGGHIPDRYRRCATFSFYYFFSFLVRKSSKMAETCQKLAKCPLFVLFERSDKKMLFLRMVRNHKKSISSFMIFFVRCMFWPPGGQKCC